MKSLNSVFLIAALLFAPAAYADEFSLVQCNADIAKALIGQKVTSGSAADIENRHKEIGLKHLGGFGITDTLFANSWRMCGQEFMLLENSTTQDVLPFPAHSTSSPGFIGTCKLNGKEYQDAIVAILIRKKGADELPASVAWKIDEKLKKFIKLSTDGILCPGQYAFTEDGGL